MVLPLVGTSPAKAEQADTPPVTDAALEGDAVLAESTAGEPVAPYTTSSASSPPSTDSAIPGTPLGKPFGFTPRASFVRLSNGKIQARLYPGVQFRRTGATDWAVVDGRVKPVADSGFPFAAPDAYRPLVVGALSSALLKVTLPQGPVVLSAPDLKSLLGTPSLQADGGLLYRDVARDTDLIVASSPSGFSLKYVLNSAQAPRTFRTRLEDPAGQLGSAEARADGGVTFSGGIGDGTRLAIVGASAYSNEELHPELGPGWRAGTANMQVTKRGLGFDIVKSVDEDWLAGRTFPVTLDPQFVYDWEPHDLDVGDCTIVAGNSTVQTTNYCTDTTYGAILGIGYGGDALLRRAILNFRINDLPYRTRVDQANLTVYAEFIDSPNHGTAPVSVRRLTEPFTSGSPQGASWRDRRSSSGVAWQTAGGTILASESPPGSMSPNSTAAPINNRRAVNDQYATSPALTSMADMVQKWYDSTLSESSSGVHPGLQLAAQDESKNIVLSIGSTEAVAARRPYLVVDFVAAPNPPRNANATGGVGEATVTWNLSDNDWGSPVTQYVVRAIRASDNVQIAMRECNSGTCQSKNFDNLPPKERVYFQVYAVNGVGESQPASTPVVDINGGVPSKPRNVVGNPDDGAIDLTWERPATDNGTPVHTYTITGRRTSGLTPQDLPSKTCQVNTEEQCLSARFSSLTNGETYQFTVSASNFNPNKSAATGTSDPESSGTLKPTGKTSPPLSVTGTARNASADVSWTAPLSNNGTDVSYYSVDAKPQAGGADPAPVIVPCNGAPCTTVRVGGLSNGKPYRFSVIARNASRYNSDEATSAVDTVPVGRPGPPNITGAYPGDGNASVTWSEPSDLGGGTLEGYNFRAIFASNGQPATPVAACTSVGCTQPYTFNLQNNVSYKLQVAARTTGVTGDPGIGEWATSDVVIPFTGVANPVRELKVTATGDKFVDLAWLRPANETRVDYYTIDWYDESLGGSYVDGAGIYDENTTSYRVGGLLNGHTYRFVVTAGNNHQTTTGPAASTTGTPSRKPYPPTSVNAVAGNASVRVTWSPPTGANSDPGNGGAGPLTYEITLKDVTGVLPKEADRTQSTSDTQYNFTGVTNYRTYEAVVRAVNFRGPSDPSAPSNRATPRPDLAPLIINKSLTPTVATARPGDVLKYKITISNPNNEAVKVNLSDVATGLKIVPTTVKVSPASVCSGACLAVSTSGITFTAGELPANGSVTLDYVAQATGRERGCSIANNAATVTAYRSDAQSVQLTTPAPVHNITVCDTGLGLERWWRFADYTVGPQSSASVNVANGNLVLQSLDTTPVQARGRLTYALRRTYNSQSTVIATLPGSIGAGWSFDYGDAGDGDVLSAGGSSLSLPSVDNAIDTVLNPLAITLADRDGTRHLFTVRGRIANGALPFGVTGPQSGLRPLTLSPASGASLCVDVAYDAPDGVHLGMWRYLSTTAGSCAASTGANSTVLGYASVRPDRLRAEYDSLGRLVALADAAGVQFRYLYASDADLNLAQKGRLTAVFEPFSCRYTSGGASTIPTTREELTDPARARSCRSFTFDYSQAADLIAPAVSVTDPAKRVTRYRLDTNTPQRLIAVDNPDGTIIRYSYGTCGGKPEQICSASDPRGVITSFTYSGDGLVATGLPKVASVTDRRGARTDHAYLSDTETVLDTPTQSFGTGVTPAHRKRYRQIDTRGRVGELEQGDTLGTSTSVLRRSRFYWDATATGAGCRQPDARTDNNLCEQLSESLPKGGTPDRRILWRYNAEGFPLVEQRTSVDVKQAGQGPALTSVYRTWGYAAQYVKAAGASTPYTDTVAGNGTVTSTSDGAGSRTTADTLFAVVDLKQSLTPRGNRTGTTPSSFAPYTTTVTVDADATVPLRTAPVATGGTATCPEDSATPNATPAITGNTGLVCETRSPATTGPSGSVAVTSRNRYDGFGQRTLEYSPKAIQLATTAGTAPLPTAYTYFANGERDLSGTVTAEGWLRLVTDPTGHFVAFGYDAAGNVARTWDRDATSDPASTAPRAAASFPGTEADRPTDSAGTVLPYAERLRASTATGSPSLTLPWRYVVRDRTPLGRTTLYTVDANGNARSVRPPRGVALSSDMTTENAHDSKFEYDAGDLLTVSRMPEDRAAGADVASRYAYDTFGNRTAVTDQSGVTSVTRYDAVDRPEASVAVRGHKASAAAPAATPLQCRPATPQDAPIAPVEADNWVCTTTMTYDGLDNLLSVTDSAGGTTTHTYDAAGQRLTTTVLRRRLTTQTDALPSTRSDTLYDADGAVVRLCRPRQNTPSPSCRAASAVAYGTELTRNVAGAVITQAEYRDGFLRNTLLRYDAGGNIVRSTDPRSYSTTATYDVLNRRVLSTTPRDYALGYTTRYQYSPAGDMVAVFEPGSQTLYTSDNPAGTTTAGKSWRITGRTYDADHRLEDEVAGLKVPVADPPATPTAVIDAIRTGISAPATQSNLRTRRAYDADGSLVRIWPERAFTTLSNTGTAALLSAPDAAFQISHDYDLNGRRTATYQPRADGRAATSDLTGDAEQAAQCPTGTPDHTRLGYPSDVQLCRERRSFNVRGDVLTTTLPTAVGASTARQVTFGYSPDRLLLTVTSPDPAQAGGATEPATVVSERRTYDPAGRPVESIDAAGDVTTTDYHLDGLVSARRLPQGQNGLQHETLYAYDADGNVARTSPQRTVVSTSSGAVGTEGVNESFTYLEDGRVSTRTIGGSSQETPLSTPALTTAYSYDEAGNPIEVYSPAAHASRNGTPTSPNEVGAPVQNTFSGDNLLLTSKQPTTIARDLATGAYRVSQWRETTYSYDAAGRKTSTQVALTGDNAQGSPTIDFYYFANGLLHYENGRRGVTDDATFTYDAAGQVVNAASRSAGEQFSDVYSYYLDGHLRMSTGGGQRSFDDVDGRGLDARRELRYAYDGSGQPTARVEASPADSGGAVLRTTRYTHNDAGLPATALENLSTATSTPTRYAYDSQGRLVTQTRPGGQVQTWHYNSDDLLKQTTVGTATTVRARWAYGYDGLGRILTQDYSGSLTSTTSIPSSAPVRYSYAYDTAGRLARFTDARGTRTITHDANNNRLSYGASDQPDPSSWTYRADDSIATYIPPTPTGGAGNAATARTFTYAPFGGVTSDGCQNYTYDGLDRLLTSDGRLGTDCAKALVEYRYDAKDRQVLRTETAVAATSSTTTGFRYDDQDDGQTVLGQLSRSSATGAAFQGLDYSLDPWASPLATKRSDISAQLLFGDGTGSTGYVTSVGGSLPLCTARYDAYGGPDGNTSSRVTAPCNSGTSVNEVWYRGGRRDAATGTYQLGSRTYDPTKAGFLTPDSYRQGGSTPNLSVGIDPLTRNIYTYVNGDPVNFIDPDGHRQEEGNSTPRNYGKDETKNTQSQRVGRYRDYQLGKIVKGLQDLSASVGVGVAGAEKARESVKNAARALSQSNDPAIRSQASWLMRNMGRPTRDLVNNPLFRNATHGLLVLDLALNAAEFSTKTDSVAEIAFRSSVKTGTAFAGGVAGAMAASAICAGTTIASGGTASAACLVLGGMFGAYAGNEVGDLVDQALFERRVGIGQGWTFVARPELAPAPTSVRNNGRQSATSEPSPRPQARPSP